jgi:pyruvate carboxylase
VVTFELNGMARTVEINDKSIAAERPARAKADPSDPLQVGAPIPGMVTELACSAGSKISKGEKLLTLEAMKMYTTINSPADGVIEEVSVAVGDAVESKDLLVRLKA